MDGRMDGWMNGRMDEWMDGWKDGWITWKFPLLWMTSVLPLKFSEAPLNT